MANKFPLVFDSANSGRIKELPSGDNLNLSGSSIVDVVNITSSGTLSVPTLNVQNINISGSGGSIAAVAFSNDFNDLDNKPVLFSGSYNDLTDVPVGVDWETVYNVPPIPTKLSQLENDTNFANQESLNIYADQIIGFAPVAISNSYKDLADANDLITKSQLVGNQINVEVTNTGDLVGSVYADDSSLLVDHLQGKLYGEVNATSVIGTEEDFIITTAGTNLNESITITPGSPQGSITITADQVTINGSLSTGVIRGAFIGDFFADDSTQIVSAADGTVIGDLVGNLKGNIQKNIGENLVIEADDFIALTTGDVLFQNAVNFNVAASQGISIAATDNLTLESSSGEVRIGAGSALTFGLNTSVDFANATVTNLPPVPEVDTLQSVTARGATTTIAIEVPQITVNNNGLDVTGNVDVLGNFEFKQQGFNIGTLQVPVNTIFASQLNLGGSGQVLGDVTGNVTGDLKDSSNQIIINHTSREINAANITATSFTGDGSGLTNVTSTATLEYDRLWFYYGGTAPGDLIPISNSEKVGKNFGTWLGVNSTNVGSTSFAPSTTEFNPNLVGVNINSGEFTIPKGVYNISCDVQFRIDNTTGSDQWYPIYLQGLTGSSPVYTAGNIKTMLFVPSSNSQNTHTVNLSGIFVFENSSSTNNKFWIRMTDGTDPVIDLFYPVTAMMNITRML